MCLLQRSCRELTGLINMCSVSLCTAPSKGESLSKTGLDFLSNYKIVVIINVKVKLANLKKKIFPFAVFQLFPSLTFDGSPTFDNPDWDPSLRKMTCPKYMCLFTAADTFCPAVIFPRVEPLACRTRH